MRELWTIPGIRSFLAVLLTVMSFGMTLAGCGRNGDRSQEESGSQKEGADYTLTTKAVDVISDPVFEDYGRLIFPVDGRSVTALNCGMWEISWYGTTM